MHNIQSIRENPDAFNDALKRRAIVDVTAESLLALDVQKRESVTQLQQLQERSNAVAKEIGQRKAQGQDADALIAESKIIKQQLAELKALSNGDHDPLEDALSVIPNRLDSDVPEGESEADNQELRRWGDVPSFDFTPRDHVDIGGNLVGCGHLPGLDFEQTAKLSGARFSTLSGPLARLERALSQFMLDHNIAKYDYHEISPPLLVKAPALYGTSQLPKFAEDLFETTDGRYLLPTSEVALANLVRQSILTQDQLPLRLTALTPCFRSEAGSAGKDTRGIVRQHQFHKIELISITDDASSEAEHERMLACAEALLQALELPYRVVLLCSGDTGFSATKTYDIEVWLPAQNTYREISSISNCRDFQARRMKARYRQEGEKHNKFVHTLNGSALAVGRTLVAILENYQQADGSVVVPTILHGYMGGITKLDVSEA